MQAYFNRSYKQKRMKNCARKWLTLPFEIFAFFIKNYINWYKQVLCFWSILTWYKMKIYFRVSLSCAKQQLKHEAWNEVWMKFLFPQHISHCCSLWMEFLLHYGKVWWMLRHQRFVFRNKKIPRQKQELFK